MDITAHQKSTSEKGNVAHVGHLNAYIQIISKKE